MTQTEASNTKNGSRVRKVRNILLKIIGGVVAAILLFLAIVYIANIVSTKSEAKKIQPYGQLVPVDGKKMNVLIQGSGEETIVLLPGHGTASPALDFKPLIDELTPYYKVVAVEPFGYGLSDLTDKERTTDNIVSELHEVLQQLGIDRFILMGHSITGIYGLDYVNKYPNEVTAFAGIDTSVPQQGGMDAKLPLKTLSFLSKSGLMRFAAKISASPYDSLQYDDQTKEQIRLITNKNSGNSNNMGELEHIFANFTGARELSFPKDLPLIFFIQEHNPGISNWVPLHEGQIKDSVHGKVLTFDGDHYLHHTKFKEIAEDFREFMKEAK
jgi:2-hydroxy-6-oxonona-2,4-dienedioate hydrolase